MTSNPHATLRIRLSPDAVSRFGAMLLDRPGGHLSWTFPGYTIEFFLDEGMTGTNIALQEAKSRGEASVLMDYTLPDGVIRPDATAIINICYGESLSCFQTESYYSAIAMCGRVIETLIGCLHEHTVGEHPQDMKNPPGLNAMLNTLKREGYSFPVGLKEKFESITLHRNRAIHGNLVRPTVDEARSVIYLTRDCLISSTQRG